MPDRHAPRLVCGEEARMPARMLALALKLYGEGVTWTDLKIDMRCTMEQHDGDHQDFVVAEDGRGAWASWSTGGQPSALNVRPDCSDPRGCCLWDGHPGGHTKDLTDPLMVAARAEVDQILADLARLTAT